MNFERQDIGLGLFVVASIGAVLVGLIMFSGALKGDRTEIRVSVSGVSGLRTGATVFVEGYRVGEIKTIDPVFDPSLHFDLTLAIDPSFPVYEGTRATITNPGLVGDAVIFLQVPEHRGLRLEDGAWISQIPSPGLASVLSRADTLLHAVERLAGRLEELVSPGVAGRLIRQMEETLRTTETTMSRLETRFIALSDSVEYGMRVGVRTLADLDAVLLENRERIATTIDSTRILMRSMLEAVDQISALAGEKSPALDRSLKNLEALLTEARTFMRDMNTHSLWQMLTTVRHPDTTTTGRRRR